jgi:hypothetical protein
MNPELACPSFAREHGGGGRQRDIEVEAREILQHVVRRSAGFLGDGQGEAMARVRDEAAGMRQDVHLTRLVVRDGTDHSGNALPPASGMPLACHRST